MAALVDANLMPGVKDDFGDTTVTAGNTASGWNVWSTFTYVRAAYFATYPGAELRDSREDEDGILSGPLGTWGVIE